MEEQEERVNEFDILVIDADSLMYKIAYVYQTPNQLTNALDHKIEDIIRKVGADETHVIIKGKDNFRYQCDPEYKGNRADTIEPEVKDRIEQLYDYARTFSVISDGCEADDICSILVHSSIVTGKRVCVAHIDKDLDMIPGYHYNYGKNKHYYMHPYDSYRFLMAQCLAGDATDNIKGIKGMGMLTASKVIGNTTNFNLLPKIIQVWKDKVPDKWQEEFVKTVNCIMLRTETEDLRPLTYDEIMERLKWDVEREKVSEENNNTVDVSREPVSESGE